MTQTRTRADTRSLLSPAEVAELANVSRKTIYREVDRGVLPAVHVGRQLRIDPSDFRSYLERGTEGGG
jgi:putative molybdopterin biosynthesis protein